MTKYRCKECGYEYEAGIISNLKILSHILVDPAPSVFNIFSVDKSCPKCGSSIKDKIKCKYS